MGRGRRRSARSASERPAGGMSDAPPPTSPRLGGLVERSRLIGADRSLVLHGGGNTSSKLLERDHLGREQQVLRIKASGVDLAAAGAADFPGLRLDELLPLREREAMTDEELVAYVARCLVEPGAPPAVDRDAAARVPAGGARRPRARRRDLRARERAGPGGGRPRGARAGRRRASPYVRPGFELARRAAALRRRARRSCSPTTVSSPGATPGRSRTAALLGLVARARAFLGPAAAAPSCPSPTPTASSACSPQLRGRLSGRAGACSPSTGASARSPTAATSPRSRLPRSTPDHMLRIGGRTCVLPPDADVDVAIDAFETSRRAVDERFAPAESSPLRTHRRRCCSSGLGAVAAAADAEARRSRSSSPPTRMRRRPRHSIASAACRGSTTSRWPTFEHWPLELDRLSSAPPPSSPGPSSSSPARPRASAARWRSTSAGAARTWRSPTSTEPGSRRPVSNRLGACDRGARRPDRAARSSTASSRRSWRRTAASTPPCSTPASPSTGMLASVADEEWGRSLDVNLTAHVPPHTPVVAGARASRASAAASSTSRRRTPSRPGAGFGPYSVAKAGLVQLARIAALEGGAAGIRANVVNPDAVFAGSRLWSEEVRRRPRRGARRPGRGARALLRLAEPARPGGDERRRRGGRRVPRLRPVAGDDGLRCHGRRRRARRLPPLAPETEAAPAPGRATLGRWPRGRETLSIGRLGEIAQVAVRHGFGFLLDERRSRSAAAGSPTVRGRHLREMLDELGPTFVKFGQLLSTRPGHRPARHHRRAAGAPGRRAPVPVRRCRARDPRGVRAADRAAVPRVRRGAARRPPRSARCTAPCCRTAVASS